MRKTSKSNPTQWAALALFTLLLASCKTTAYIEPALQNNATVMTVSGRHKWFSQKLSFGPYQSGKVSRGWTATKSTGIVVHNQYAKNKFSFSLCDNKGDSSEVFMTGKLTQSGIALFGGKLRWKAKDVCAGTIYLGNNGDEWDFALYNAEKSEFLKQSTGELNNGKQTFRIVEEERLANGNKRVTFKVSAYKFQLDDKTVGMVDLINFKGRVVISNDLTPEMQFVVANAAAVLLLRQDLEDDLN